MASSMSPPKRSASRSRKQDFGLSYSFSGGRSEDVKQTEEIPSYKKIRDKR